MFITMVIWLFYNALLPLSSHISYSGVNILPENQFFSPSSPIFTPVHSYTGQQHSIMPEQSSYNGACTTGPWCFQFAVWLPHIHSLAKNKWCVSTANQLQGTTSEDLENTPGETCGEKFIDAKLRLIMSMMLCHCCGNTPVYD